MNLFKYCNERASQNTLAWPSSNRRVSSRALQSLIVTILIALFLLSANAGEVTFLLHWSHQAQFAGYYVAKDKGFYQKRGWDVVIKRGGYDVDDRAFMAEGKPAFCTTMLFTALEIRDKGFPLVHLAQVVNRANFTLVAWKKRGILKPEDLQDRRVTLWLKEYEAPYDGFFKRYGLHPVIEPQFFTVNLFLRGGVDACAAMYYNEYHTLLQCGIDPEELTTFNMWEHGADFPEDGIYCTEQIATSQPALCRDIVQASLEGWTYTRDHPEEALDIVMEYVRRGHVPTNRAHMKWMLEKMLASIFPGAKDTWQFGVLSPERYNHAVMLLRGQQLIRGAPAFSEFHPPSFTYGVTTEGRSSSFTGSLPAEALAPAGVTAEGSAKIQPAQSNAAFTGQVTSGGRELHREVLQNAH